MSRNWLVCEVAGLAEPGSRGMRGVCLEYAMATVLSVFLVGLHSGQYIL